MGGFLSALGQAVEGGIKGWETGSRWQREAEAEKERKRLRDEDIEMKGKLKALEVARTSGTPEYRWDAQNPEPATPPPPDPATIAANTTQAAPPQQAIPAPPAQAALPPPQQYYPPRGVPSGSPLDPNLGAQGGPFVSPTDPLAPTPAALPPTDTQRAAAAVVPPPPQAIPLDANKDVPAKDMVTVADRYTTAPNTVPKSETVPKTDYDYAVERASIYRQYGKEQEAASTIQQYVAQDAAKINQIGRQAEMAGMEYITTGNTKGLEALSATNPMGVGFEMTKNADGQVAFALNPRGTVAPTVYIGPDGAMSTTPVYMGVHEVTSLLRGAATGNMADAVATIATIQSQFVSKAQGLQAIAASKAAVQTARDNTAISAANSWNANTQVNAEAGNEPIPFDTYRSGIGLSGATGEMPGGTGGTGGSLPSAPSSPSGVTESTAANTVVGYGKYGNPPKLLTSMTMGEVDDWGRKVLIPATRNSRELGLAGTDKGTSATGMYQITSETMREFAPKVFGKDWRSMDYTAENQDKIAERIFNDSKGGNLQKRWAALPDSRPGAYKDRTWASMRSEIVQREVGGGSSGTSGRGLPTSTASAPSTTPGTGLTPQKQAKYAGGGLFTTPKKLEQEVVTARGQAQQAADAAVAATAKQLAAQGKSLPQDAADAIYRNAFNHAVTQRISSYDNRDKERLSDELIPGVKVDLRGNRQLQGADIGPNQQVYKKNPFATGTLTVDKANYWRTRKAVEQRKVNPQVRELMRQFEILKQKDPAYARRIAQPMSSDTVALPPAVSVSGQ